MKYFPLEVLDNFNDQAKEAGYETFTRLPKSLIDLASEQTGEPIPLDDDFSDFLFSPDFFDYNYQGKYEKVNEFFMYDQTVNSLILNGFSMFDVNQRKTEWRDLFGESLVLDAWAKSKCVYKIDDQFFHEIKNTTNLKISADLLKHLPFSVMYFDLSEVKNIGDFNGAWVDVHHVKDNTFMLAIYMVTDGSINPTMPFALFSYYCGFNFISDDQLVEIDPQDTIYSQVEDYYIRDYQDFDDGGLIVRQPLEKSNDHRGEIVVAIMQVLEFLHAEIPDINESPVTKNTYRPSTTVKNKFSEVRMWDVGVKYGKAILTAKKQVEQLVKSENDLQTGLPEKKSRKPIRPHIRSAHWQRYHVGEGRKQIKVNWIPPTYVCGKQEIPVTIHQIK